VSIEDLGPSDRDRLAAFRCAAPGEPWASLVQQMIRQELADALALGTTWAIGIVEDGPCPLEWCNS
jgi:hypothetical protein